MDNGRELTGRTAQAIGIAAITFLALWLVHDPTDAVFGEPGSGLGRLFHEFRDTQQGAPVLGGAEATTSAPQPEPEPEPTTRPAPTAGEPVRPRETGGPGPLGLIDPEGRGLRAFREALRRGGLVRVLHYGDSLIDTDFVAGSARRILQRRFGDGGHGFINPGKPWPWYRHWDVVHATRGNWNVSLATHTPARDGRYGLGGASFRPWGGAATIGTTSEGALGRRVSRFEIAYLEQPGGGTLIAAVDGREERVATAGPTPASRWREIRVADGPHRLELRAAGDGEVRLFGVVLEREHGLVWDSLGINGARVRILAGFDEAHWAEQLRHRDPDLVVLGFGLNEAENRYFPVGRWPELIEVVRRLRAAVPEASCLLMGPPDRVDREGGAYRSRAVVRRITDRQREVALEQGCAFFDLQAAMGGEGAAARWARLRPRLVAGDLTHLTPEGAARVGEMLAEALP